MGRQVLNHALDRLSGRMQAGAYLLRIDMIDPGAMLAGTDAHAFEHRLPAGIAKQLVHAVAAVWFSEVMVVWGAGQYKPVRRAQGAGRRVELRRAARSAAFLCPGRSVEWRPSTRRDTDL